MQLLLSRKFPEEIKKIKSTISLIFKNYIFQQANTIWENMFIFDIIPSLEIKSKIRLITLKCFTIYLQQSIYFAGIINEDFPDQIM